MGPTACGRGAAESQGEWEQLVRGWLDCCPPSHGLLGALRWAGQRPLLCPVTSRELHPRETGAAHRPSQGAREEAQQEGEKGEGNRRDSGLSPSLVLWPFVPSPAGRSWPCPSRGCRTHTGRPFLAFFSDFTASSWAFLFSASLLACEEGRDEAGMGRGVGCRGGYSPFFYMRPFLKSRAS